MVLLGVTGVGTALLLGVLVGAAGNPLDRAVTRTLGRWCAAPACRAVSEPLAVESGAPYGAYVTAVAPLVVVGGVLLSARVRLGSHARTVALRWLLVALTMVAVQEVLSRVYGRVGPLADPGDPAHAYPSGAALLVGLGWLGGGAVVTEFRPGWRRAWWAVTAVVLLVHALARVATAKHWVTDISGSYLLAAGAYALAAGLWPAGRVDEEGPGSSGEGSS
jgi:membrane-associated phospholipid phosphatase